MKTYGQANFDILINGQMFSIIFIVADLIDIQSILGISFLNQNKCVIDICEGILHVGSMEVYLHSKQKQSCCYVHLNDEVVIPSNRETIIKCSIDIHTWDEFIGTGLAESVEAFNRNSDVVVSDAIVKVDNGIVSLTCFKF